MRIGDRRSGSRSWRARLTRQRGIDRTLRSQLGYGYGSQDHDTEDTARQRLRGNREGDWGVW